MSIQWADNFDNYGFTEAFMDDGIYSQVYNCELSTDPDVTETGKCLFFDSNGTGSFIRYPLQSGTITTGGTCFKVWYPSLPNSANQGPMVSFRDSNNSPQITISANTTGGINVYRGAYNGTLLGSTPAPVITANAWHHIEVKATIDDAAGAVEVRVNGVSILTLSTVDTKNTAVAGYNQYKYGDDLVVGSLNNEFYIKDIVVWDTLGSQNNDFLGSVNVYTLIPDGDSSLNWTPSTGTTGYDLLDENDPNDADYISADTTPPSPAVFTMSDLPADITSVRALISLVRAQKTDGGDGNIQAGIISNAMTDLGADHAITPAFTYWYDVSELSPDTGVAYTPTEVNNITFQIDRTT